MNLLRPKQKSVPKRNAEKKNVNAKPKRLRNSQKKNVEKQNRNSKN